MHAPQGDHSQELHRLDTIYGDDTDDDNDHAIYNSNDDDSHDDNDDSAPPAHLVDAAAHAVPSLVPGEAEQPADGENDNCESENEGPALGNR